MLTNVFPHNTHIYRCICQSLHEKITILVTHQLQYLKAASQILILKDVSDWELVIDLELAELCWHRGD